MVWLKYRGDGEVIDGFPRNGGVVCSFFFKSDEQVGQINEHVMITKGSKRIHTGINGERAHETPSLKNGQVAYAYKAASSRGL